MAEPPAAPPVSEIRALVLVKGSHEGELTRRLLREAQLASELCTDVQDLCRKIQEGAGLVLLAEEVLTEALLKPLAQVLSRQPAWSDLPIVIFSAPNLGTRGVTGAALGNVTFLDRPVHVRTMVAAVQAALRSRGRQYEARRAIESRDSFLAMLGHELRNPLGAISLALAALNRKAASQPRPTEYGVVDRQVRHLSRLVDELLDVARVTHGKVTLARRRVDLAEVAKVAFEACELRAREQDLAWRLEVSERPLFVEGDRPRLEQVIGNLLTNAIKYTPRGGSVTLRVEADAATARVSIEDSGVGLVPEMLERVFAPFAQVDSTLERSQGGLGLGLALVRSLVALHGGTVQAFSDGLGRGCRFEVTLPRLNAVEQEADSAPTSTPAPPPPLLRIVLVEDNLDIRELFAESLQVAGHTVTCAADGPSGLDALLSFGPDVAFIDVGLPGFDGYELARRARSSGSRARLIALTGYGQKEDKTRALDAGFDEHLVKPVVPEEIERTLARA